MKKTPEALLNLSTLSIHWNWALHELLVSVKIDPDANRQFFGVVVENISDVRMKEPIHITNFLKAYGVGVEKASESQSVKETTVIHTHSASVVEAAYHAVVSSMDGHVFSSASLPKTQHDDASTFANGNGSKKRKRSSTTNLGTEGPSLVLIEPASGLPLVAPVAATLSAAVVLAPFVAPTGDSEDEPDTEAKKKRQKRRACPVCEALQHRSQLEQECEFYKIFQTVGGGGGGRFENALKKWKSQTPN